MNTQIIFKIEKKLKRAAQRKAAKESITLSDFYRLATKSFVEGDFEIGIKFENHESWDMYDKKSKISFRKGLDDFKGGKFHRVV